MAAAIEYEVTDLSGRTVTVGEEIRDFRGDIAIFQGVSRAPFPGKSAKVIVTQSGIDREFYERVFGLIVRPKTCPECGFGLARDGYPQIHKNDEGDECWYDLGRLIT